ncbi:hypothetical protein GGR58DRAFT_475869 [Xylaria digitata]|nr:hypothetical protein GGR58DRAFT_475869 [Xylaria digitata]
MKDQGVHDKSSLAQNTQLQVLPVITMIEALSLPAVNNGDGDSEITKATGVETTGTRSRRTKRRAIQKQICSNQEDSCRAYGITNIHCPIGMTCYSGAYSPSSIYHCKDGSNCLDANDIPPECTDNTFYHDPRQIGSACSLDECLISLQTKRDSVSTLPENDYIPPTAHTVTATSSTKSFVTTKIGETAQSTGPKGIRQGFGFSSMPTLEELTLGAAVAIAWIAAWRYL